MTVMAGEDVVIIKTSVQGIRTKKKGGKKEAVKKSGKSISKERERGY